MSDVLITQTATVVFRARYTRAELVDMLDGIDGDRDLGAMTNRALATLAVNAANSNDDPGLYEKFSGDSDEAEVIDVDAWELTIVYGEQASA